MPKHRKTRKDTPPTSYETFAALGVMLLFVTAVVALLSLIAEVI